jgi:hypothetical protein
VSIFFLSILTPQAEDTRRKTLAIFPSSDPNDSAGTEGANLFRPSRWLQDTLICVPGPTQAGVTFGWEDRGVTWWVGDKGLLHCASPKRAPNQAKLGQRPPALCLARLKFVRAFQYNAGFAQEVHFPCGCRDQPIILAGSLRIDLEDPSALQGE